MNEKRPASHFGATEVAGERMIPGLAHVIRSIGWIIDESDHLAPTTKDGGRTLMPHEETPLERAMKTRGPAQQTPDWKIHPKCADPKRHSGYCTMWFPRTGEMWCFHCEEAWRP